MSSITLDQEAGRLENLTEAVVVIRNSTGRVLGRFIPEEISTSSSHLEIPFSEEDLTRREKVREGFTTSQVHAYLRSLAESHG